MFKNIVGYFKRKKELNRIKKIDVMEETKVTRMCISYYYEKSIQCQYSDNQKQYGGMIRGMTIHMWALKREIEGYKNLGKDTEELDNILDGYTKRINDCMVVRLLISTPYIKELLEEGWFTENNEKYIKATLEQLKK